MKKLFLTLLLALCTVFALAGLAACDGASETGGTQQGGHTNEQTGGNTSDNTDTGDNTGGEEQIKSYNVTVTCGEGGGYTLSHENPIEVNTSVTLTVTENVGYEVSRVTVGGRRVDLTDLTYTFEVKRNTAIEITFKSVPIVYRTVKVNCDEGGSYEISHSGNDVAERTVVTLSVTPDADHELDAVYINGALAVFEEGVCTFTVRGNTTVVVRFKQHVHAYPAWTVQNPTESETGIATRSCPNCTEEATGHTVTHTLPELGDDRYSIHCDRKEDCEFEGLYTYAITLEGDEISFVHTVGLLPHTYEYSVHEIPTTSREGTAIGVCSVCSEKARGHVRAITLPAVDPDVYSITDHTEPTCTTGSTDKCTITLQGHEFTFVTEKADEKGHTFVEKHSDTRTYYECSVCGENNQKSIIQTGQAGVWRNEDQSVKMVQYMNGTVSVNGSEPVSGKSRQGFTGSFYTFGTGDDAKTYEIEYDAISVYNLDGSTSTEYNAVFSEIATGTNVRITQHLYKNDYKLGFPEEIDGTSWSGTVMGEYTRIKFSGNLLYVSSRLVDISSYRYLETGFQLSCSYGSSEPGIAASGSTASYTIEYNKTTGKVILTDNSVTEEAAENAGFKKTVECTKAESSDTVEHQGIFSSNRAGLYVAATGDIFTIDEKGVLYFNNTYIALDYVDEDKGGVVIHQFIFHSCAWTIRVSEDYITAVCPALGIEKLIFYYQAD